MAMGKQMIITSKVTYDFIERRNYLVFNSNRHGRSLQQHMIHSDCEYAEQHISTLVETGHVLHEGMTYDTVYTDEDGVKVRCEFKHVPKNNMVYISEWCRQQDFDSFVQAVC